MQAWLSRTTCLVLLVCTLHVVYAIPIHDKVLPSSTAKYSERSLHQQPAGSTSTRDAAPRKRGHGRATPLRHARPDRTCTQYTPLYAAIQRTVNYWSARGGLSKEAVSKAVASCQREANCFHFKVQGCPIRLIITSIIHAWWLGQKSTTALVRVAS
jgi:hypothetical protein